MELKEFLEDHPEFRLENKYSKKQLYWDDLRHFWTVGRVTTLRYEFILNTDSFEEAYNELQKD